MKNLKLLFVLGLFLITLSCSSDDNSDSSEEMSIEEQVENFVTLDLIAALEDLGFIFRDGEETPNLIGNYIVNQVSLANTNIPDDGFDIGDSFAELSLNFISQNNEERTFNINIIQAGFIDSPTETFFSGSGNQFSAYVKSDRVSPNGVELVALQAFSGIITEEGIIDFQSALLVLEKGEDPDGELIEVGEGRLFIDEDGLVERFQGRISLPDNFNSFNLLRRKAI